MKIKIEFRIDTEAFENPEELRETLEYVADLVSDGRLKGDIVDSDDIYIGSYEVLN